LLSTIAGASLADWPVSYDDLEPYYEKAEYGLGVSGDENPYGPKRKRPLQLPPVPDDTEARCSLRPPAVWT
jgi:choline dehydrogenase-like flavoprotein